MTDVILAKKEEIPSPVKGFFLEIHLFGYIETVKCESLSELLDTYKFLRHVYDPFKSSFSYSEDQYEDLLVNRIGRDDHGNPKKIVKLLMYEVIYDYGYYKQFFEEVRS